MGLKLLVFPTLIGLSLVLAVMFIYPDVMSILEQQQIETTKQDALLKVEGVEKNIQNIVGSLDSKKETEALVKRYYPEKMDQERAVDMVNFLAQQSGVIITGLTVTEQDVKKKSVPIANDVSETADGGIDILSDTEPTVEPPKSYKVNVSVIGTYESARSFFERLYKTDRLRVMDMFTLQEIASRTEQDKESIPDNFLEGSISLDFRYAPLRRAGNVLHHPLFQTGAFDYSSTNQLADFINSPVNDLFLPTTGRNNPFERLP